MSVPNTDWKDQAACRNVDPAVFFPDTETGPIQALRVCVPCPVQTDCAAYADHIGADHGVWGGQLRKRHVTYERARGWTVAGSLPDQLLTHLETLGGWTAASELADLTGRNLTHVNRSLWRLKTRQLVEKRNAYHQAEWRAA